MKPFKAIAAMALNRVIGHGSRIPWHLPEDFRWFKSLTTGHVLVMGRRTFEAIGRPLPHRETLVLSHSGFHHPGVRTVSGLAAIRREEDPREYFICGGAQVYAEALPYCSDLYLTLVHRTVVGDVFFPPFEESFQLAATLRRSPEFDILHYTNPSPLALPGLASSTGASSASRNGLR